MMFINIADLTDPETGKTYRQLNNEKTHKLKLGMLVEIKSEECPEHHGARLFIVHLGRDCDGTPLYWLSGDRSDTKKEGERFPLHKWHGGWAEESLIEIDKEQP